MWKIRCGGINIKIDKDEFTTFDDATVGFRKSIQKAVGVKRIEKYAAMIDTYCAEFYPEGAPQAFENFKSFLINYVTDPSFPQDPDNYHFETFEDQNVKIWMNTRSKTLKSKTKRKQILYSFPTVIIDYRMVDKPEKEFRFEISVGEMSAWDDRYDLILLCLFNDLKYRSYGNLTLGDLAAEAKSSSRSQAYPSAKPKTPPSKPKVSNPVRSQSLPAQPQKLRVWEKAEIHLAKQAYEQAINRVKMHPNSRSIYEAEEKRAYAHYMSVLAKYAGRE